jgi:hypothetical protein
MMTIALPEIVYFLCAATSAVCAALLLRQYWRRHSRLLLWSALCFVGLALNNALLFVDLVLVPLLDLSLWRGLTGVAALMLLLYGLISERPSE